MSATGPFTGEQPYGKAQPKPGAHAQHTNSPVSFCWPGKIVLFVQRQINVQVAFTSRDAP
jgi:hypothetical protein